MGTFDKVSSWLASFTNWGGRFSGRYRDRQGWNDQSFAWLAEVPDLSGYEDPYFKEPNQWMSPHDIYRLQLYKWNKALYSGDHYNAFRFAQYLYKSGAMDEDSRLRDLFGKGGMDVLFVAMNAFALTTDTYADLITEALSAITPAKPDEAVTAAIKRISDNSDLRKMLWLSVATGCYKGDSVWTIHGQAEPAPKVYIRGRRVNTWFPRMDAADNLTWAEHAFIYRTGNVATREIYLPDGRILTDVQKVSGNRFTGPLGELNIFDAGLGESLAFHIPNKLSDDDNPFGDSDYGRGVLSIADEINHRLTQLSYELDKHGNLGMSGPPMGGEETENPSGDNPDNAGAGGKYVTLFNPDDPRPQYVEYPTGHLDAAMRYVERLTEETVRQMRMSPRLLGYKSGAAEESFDTLRLACIQTVLRNRGRIEMLDRALRWAFKQAFALENHYKVPGAVDPDTQLKIKWGDGFPVDPEKKARLWGIRTGNKQTGSVAQAVADLDGEDGVEETLKEIRTEENADAAATPGLKPFGSRQLQIKTPAEINAGMEEPKPAASDNNRGGAGAVTAPAGAKK